MSTVDPEQFFREYVNAALSYMTNDSCESFFFTWGINNIVPDDLIKMRTDCTSFLLAATPLLIQGKTTENAGLYFFFTRNRTGTGYFASVWPPDVADQLTTIALSYPEQRCFVGIDGAISVYP